MNTKIAKIFLSLLCFFMVSFAEAQVTDSVTNGIPSLQKLTNYVRGAFPPDQFNTNSYPYRLTNISGSVTINNITVSNSLQFLPNTNNPGYVLTSDANGFGYWSPAGSSLITNLVANTSGGGYTNNSVFTNLSATDKDFLIVGAFASGVGTTTTAPFIYIATNSVGVCNFTNMVYVNTTSNAWPIPVVDMTVGTSNVLIFRIVSTNFTSGALHLNIYRLN